MRPKFVIALGLLAGLIFGGVFFLKPQPARLPTLAVEGAAVPAPTTVPAPNISTVETAPAATAAPIAASEAAPAASTIPATPAASVHPTAIVVLSAEERAAVVSRLEDWSTQDDKQSLSNIVAELGSPDQKVREAAIEATRQFGSADAIPALKVAAARTDNTDDKIAMLEAAKFLAIPPLGSGAEPDNAPAAENGNGTPPPSDTPPNP